MRQKLLTRVALRLKRSEDSRKGNWRKGAEDFGRREAQKLLNNPCPSKETGQLPRDERAVGSRR